jgi:DNA-3-methyladenine glycosylase II
MNELIKITKPEIFNFQMCLKFLDRGYTECLYVVSNSSVKRLIRLTSGLALIEVYDDESNIIVKTSDKKLSSLDRKEIIAYVFDWFDLNRDIQAFYQLLLAHQQTKYFPERYHGLRLMGIVDLFEALCWCVIGQQINLTFAHKIKTRLVHKYGESEIVHGKTYYCFPKPEVLANLDRKELVAMQFSKQKINYVINIAQAFCQGQLDKTELLRLNKTEQMKKLTAIKGIGPWTANYVSMKCLRDMTCIAYGDTGLSSSLHKNFETDKKPSHDVIDKVFEPYAGWESYLNFYLWRSLSPK